MISGCCVHRLLLVGLIGARRVRGWRARLTVGSWGAARFAMVASMPAGPGGIFISYRRADTAYPASWLFDRLADRFGRAQIFKDIDSIQLGDDFAEAIVTAVGGCSVLLALIGDRWLTITNADGQRRLDNPEDFVRLEIETALARNVRVIPILVEGARMPQASELPPSLGTLVRRQALELSSSRFGYDSGRLISVLDKELADIQARRVPEAARESATVGLVQVPDAAGHKGEPHRRERAPRGHARAGILAGASTIIVSLVALLIYLLVGGHGPHRSAGTPPPKLIFSDDFSGKSGSWMATSSHAQGKYTNQAYQLSVDPEYLESAVPRTPSAVFPSAPSNITISVAAHRILGTAENDQYGIMCHGYGVQAYFLMVSNSSAMIAKYLPNESVKTLTAVPVSAIHVDASNELRASCADVSGRQAVRLIFWVNGKQVATVTDSSNPIPDGSVGVFVGANTRPAGAVFSHFVVTAPALHQ